MLTLKIQSILLSDCNNLIVIKLCGVNQKPNTFFLYNAKNIIYFQLQRSWILSKYKYIKEHPKVMNYFTTQQINAHILPSIILTKSFFYIDVK